MIRTLFRLVKVASPFKWWMVLASILGFLTIGSSIGLVMTATYIVAKAALHPSIAELQVSIVGVRFFGIMRGVLRYFERVISHDVTFRLLTHFRTWFYKSIEPLKPAEMMKFRSGDLFTRLLNDVQNLENVYLRIIAPPLVAVMISISTFILYGLFSWYAAFVLIIGLLFAGIGIPLLSAKLRKGLGEKLVLLRSEMNIVAIDGIQGLADLLVFNQADDHFSHLKAISKQYVNIQRKNMLIESLLGALSVLTLNLTIVGTLLILIPRVSSGALDAVYFSVLVLGVIAVFEAVLPIPEAIQNLEKSLKSADRLFEVIAPQKQEKQPPAYNFLREKFDIRVEGLSFCYDKNQGMVLDDIDLDLSMGRKVAIVGPSGSGKSTIVNLLLDFWPYGQGRIYYDNKELTEYNRDLILTKLSVLPQNIYLFSTTLRDNLLLSRPTTQDSVLNDMVNKIGLGLKINNLPDGLESWVGEMGYRFSGGERQQIALARTFLKDAPILILDEPTANLDPITEMEILQVIRTLSERKTLLMITHRLTGLTDMDEIIVLVDGRIIERGSHESLMGKKGYYYKMLQIQEDVFIDYG